MTAGASIWDRQLVLVTGKGGVGKTTVTASLAKSMHRSGKRVLVAEVAPEPSGRSELFAHFGLPAADPEEPRRIQPGLFGVRVCPSTGHKLFLRAALKVKVVVDAAMKSAALRRFLLAAPSFPEIGTLYQLVTLIRSGQFDHIVVDLPASGHALAFVSLPKTVLKVISSGLVGDAIREGLDVLTDGDRTAAVLVTLPEDLPVTESLELASGLRALSIPVRAMILNRMPSNPFSEDERNSLNGHLQKTPSPLLLGTREFRRLERALVARQTFRDGVPEDVRRIEISVALKQGRRSIIDHVAQGLCESSTAPVGVSM